MLITTTNEVAGYEIQEVIGEVFGLTVRSTHTSARRSAPASSRSSAGSWAE